MLRPAPSVVSKAEYERRVSTLAKDIFETKKKMRESHRWCDAYSELSRKLGYPPSPQDVQAREKQLEDDPARKKGEADEDWFEAEAVVKQYLRPETND